MWNMISRLLRRNLTKPSPLIPLIIIIVFIIANESAMAGTATLTWSAPTTNVDGTPLTGLAGYKIYYGTTSHVYGTAIDVGLNVGNPPSYTVNNLGSGTYYFAVTSYTTLGLESGFSAEASKSFDSSSQNSAQNPTVGGCGMIIPKDGESTKPGQAADMLAILSIILAALIRKISRQVNLGYK